MRCSAGMSSASATSGASVRVGDHQLDLVALGVVEDERLRLRRVEAQQLAECVWLAIRRSIQYSSES